MLALHDLPGLNAALNCSSAVFLVVGYLLIRRGNRRAHRACMLAAFACSTLFLTSYLVYHAQVGSVRFSGTGVLRTLYLSLLASHTVLAALVPLLAIVTLYRAHRGRFAAHRSIARLTLPIWLWVSVSGVAVYWMLYQMS
jgi:uncharacterized membrane protein YozB (DUF420 family)